MSKTSIYTPQRLKKTQQKIVDYFSDKPYYVKSKLAASDLGISRETLTKNLRTLDDMNVLERVNKSTEIAIFINSEEDWQVHQKGTMPKGWEHDSYKL